MRGTLVLCADLESLSRQAAERLAAAVAAEAPRRRPFALALAGGATPRRLYELLAAEPYRSTLPWKQLHFFWGDERLVPHDHKDSNYRVAHDALLSKVPVPSENLHTFPMHFSPDEAARAYEARLRAHFGERRGVPVFDLVLLGLGADGHTASLFPGASALDETKRLVVTHRAAGGPARVTLTLPVINRARRVLFLVAGADKAAALRMAIEGKGKLPAQRVAPAKGDLLWFVDAAAAARLHNLRVETAAVSEP